MPRFSVIVPVYNRIDEVSELLESLAAQTCRDFEVLIVEDGSTEPCDGVCARYPFVKYCYKENEGRSIARNRGMELASGDYFLFFDSDCVIPPVYLAVLSEELDRRQLDCFGGPDAAHDSFTPVQKAINFAMTSFMTTGGIRGGKVQLEKFTPRTFNMGFSRRVWERVGGFREMFSEDIDMSMRIRREGFSMGLIRQAAVYHRRRQDFAKFRRQVYVRHVAHHTETAISRFAKIGAYASGVVFGRYGSVGASRRFCESMVAAAARTLCGGAVCECVG